MKYEGTVLSQLLQLIPRDEFQRIVDKYKGDCTTSKLNCWSQFVCLFYGQLRQRDSLRDIETGLEVQRSKLYHLGLSQPVKRSTLSDANNNRSYRIYEDLFNHFLKKCQRLNDKKFTQIWIAMTVYLLLWYIKHQTNYRFSLLKLSRIINETIFERVHLIDILQLRVISSLYTDHVQLAFDFP